MKEIMKDRKNNQPINKLTSGSTFKNPYKMKSWELLMPPDVEALL